MMSQFDCNVKRVGARSAAMAKAVKRTGTAKRAAAGGYDVLLDDIARVLEVARRSVARSVNAHMTATYWLIGKRIVEQEQKGERRAEYGEQLVKTLAVDLTKRFGRGFSARNLEQMRVFI